jgi:hypothetical protein
MITEIGFDQFFLDNRAIPEGGDKLALDARQ